jgi:hypothetical protein
MITIALLLSSLLLLLPLTSYGYPLHVCQRSGMCSFEHIKGSYSGPLDTNKDLRAALDSLSYKRNIIITEETRVDAAAQFLRRCHRAGYYHAVRKGLNEAACAYFSPGLYGLAHYMQLRMSATLLNRPRGVNPATRGAGQKQRMLLFTTAKHAVAVTMRPLHFCICPKCQNEYVECVNFVHFLSFVFYRWSL